MARTVQRKLVGRTITKDQLDNIITVVKRKFRAPAHYEFSIHRGSSDSHTKNSLESVVRAAGSPTIVRKFSIEATSDRCYFRIDVKYDVIEMKVRGEDDYFAPGFLDEIARILDPQPTLISKALTRPVHLVLRCLLVLGVLASVIPLFTSGRLDWNGITTCSALALLSLFTLAYIERRVSSYVLLKTEAKERKRAERIALVGAAATLLVGLMTNGVNLAINASRASVDSKSSASPSPYNLDDELGDRTPNPSRDTARESLASISVVGSLRPGSEFATLTGNGFTPGEDVEVNFSNGTKGVTPRANSRGEIGPIEIHVGSMEDGQVKITAIGGDSQATVNYVYTER
ncbi:hypothetical protein KUF83_25300 [Streptomyces sp. BV286]|uniref:hypothetical protein n=1 Tax=Streptomyces sp. BV286 TaxID=2849672 RepID=UPI001C2E1415|nr:hypothetical protein [Streptomyces sp. BV286]MBV1939858.1 hypothetical protein [Streptomyces sp. BV286]